MKSHPRKNALVFAVCALMAMPLLAAPKRRAIAHPTTGTPFVATITGTVIDAATNQPVINATVSAGDHSVTTSAQGAFQLTNVSYRGTLAVTAARTGYTASTQNVTGGGTHPLTFRLNSTPTVTVRMVNGTTHIVDREELKLGYVILFVGMAAFEHEDFCFPDGSQARVNTSQMKRIVGPAVKVTQSNCCAARDIQRVQLELRDGTNTAAFFKDSCQENEIDLVARVHATGQVTFLKFSEIAEVIFP